MLRYIYSWRKSYVRILLSIIPPSRMSHAAFLLYGVSFLKSRTRYVTLAQSPPFSVNSYHTQTQWTRCCALYTIKISIFFLQVRYFFWYFLSITYIVIIRSEFLNQKNRVEKDIAIRKHYAYARNSMPRRVFPFILFRRRIMKSCHVEHRDQGRF